MKTNRIAMLIACIASTIGLMAQNSDTLVIANPSQVIIAQADDTLSIQVAGKNDNPDYRFSREVVLQNDGEVHTTATQSRHSALGWDFSIIENESNGIKLSGNICSQIMGGFRYPLGKPAGMSGYRWKSSPEISINLSTLTLTFGRSKYWGTFDWNIGIKQMTLKGDNRFYADRDGNVLLGGYPTGTTSDQSSLFWLENQYEIGVHRLLGKESNIGLGLIWEQRGNNSFCRSKYVDVDGKTTRQTAEITSLRSNHFSFKAEYNFWDSLGLFVKYSPWSDFHTGCGPSYSPLTFGFTIRF